jgi:hypothetical protein
VINAHLFGAGRQVIFCQVIGGQDLIGEHAAREGVVDRAEVDDAAADQRAARAIEVAAERVHALLEPECERTVAAHVDAGRAVEGGAVRGGVRGDQFAQLRGRDLRHRFGALGRPRGDELLDFVRAAHVLRCARAIDAALREEFVQERKEEEHVAAGADRQPLAGDFRGLGAPWIDHDDAPAARLDRVQALPRVRNLEEAPLRDDRIRADDE